MPGRLLGVAIFLIATGPAFASNPPPVISDVEGQPLAANARRLIQALDVLGAPLEANLGRQLTVAIDVRDVRAIQKFLDARVLFVVHINPESRVKVARGPAEVTLHQAGYVPVLVKIVNESTVKKQMRILSPQAGTVYSGAGRPGKDPKANPKIVERFLDAEMYTAPPMTADLSGLKVEYAIALLYSS